MEFSYSRNRNQMIKLQYYTFSRQTLSSALILEPSLALTYYLINYIPGYNYDAGVVLDNSDFNTLIWIIGGMGIISCLLSIKPNWTDLFKLSKRKEFISTGPSNELEDQGYK